MLTFSQQQMDAFQSSTMHRFETQMMKHLRQLSPVRTQAADDNALREFVKHGIQQAAQYGFIARGSVQFYLECMLWLGCHFDKDPQHPWIKNFLQSHSDTDEITRADILHDKMSAFFTKTTGPDDIFLATAFERAAFTIKHKLFVPQRELVSDLVAELQQLYPQRAENIDPQALTSIAQKGLSAAQAQNITLERGGFAIASLLFLLGYNCGRDPLYPWVLQSLTGETSEEKLTKLETQTQAWLTQADQEIKNKAKGAQYA